MSPRKKPAPTAEQLGRILANIGDYTKLIKEIRKLGITRLLPVTQVDIYTHAISIRKMLELTGEVKSVGVIELEISRLRALLQPPFSFVQSEDKKHDPRLETARQLGGYVVKRSYLLGHTSKMITRAALDIPMSYAADTRAAVLEGAFGMTKGNTPEHSKIGKEYYQTLLKEIEYQLSKTVDIPDPRIQSPEQFRQKETFRKQELVNKYATTRLKRAMMLGFSDKELVELGTTPPDFIPPDHKADFIMGAFQVTCSHPVAEAQLGIAYYELCLQEFVADPQKALSVTKNLVYWKMQEGLSNHKDPIDVVRGLASIPAALATRHPRLTPEDLMRVFDIALEKVPERSLMQLLLNIEQARLELELYPADNDAATSLGAQVVTLARRQKKTPYEIYLDATHFPAKIAGDFIQRVKYLEGAQQMVDPDSDAYALIAYRRYKISEEGFLDVKISPEILDRAEALLAEHQNDPVPSARDSNFSQCLGQFTRAHPELLSQRRIITGAAAAPVRHTPHVD